MAVDKWGARVPDEFVNLLTPRMKDWEAILLWEAMTYRKELDNPTAYLRAMLKKPDDFPTWAVKLIHEEWFGPAPYPCRSCDGTGVWKPRKQAAA